MSNRLRIEYLSLGNRDDSNGNHFEFTEDTLKEINEATNKAIAEGNIPPFVIGHPKDNEPAFGQVVKSEMIGDKLVATVDNVHDELKKAWDAKNYSKVSASIWGRDSTANPVQGSKGLRHLGALGAPAPAIPHLKELQKLGAFNADDAQIYVTDLSSAQNKGDPDMSENVIKEKDDKIAELTAAVEEANKARAEAEAKVAEATTKEEGLEKQVAELVASSNKAADEKVVDGLIKDNKLAVGQKDSTVALLASARDGGNYDVVVAHLNASPVLAPKTDADLNAPDEKTFEGKVIGRDEIADYVAKHGGSAIQAYEVLRKKVQTKGE